MIPEAPAVSAPAGTALLAGSVPPLCPKWKWGHCTGEGWCPRQQLQPAADYGTLPAVGRAAARAPLSYGVARRWILDETTRASVNIQEAVDGVTHTGQTEVALHTRGRHGGPAEGIVVEPTGMVLVLAADMVRGVPHASRVRRAPAVDHPGVQPSRGVAFLHMGSTCRHVLAAGSAGAVKSPGCAGAMGCGEPAISGANRGASPAGMDP